MFLSLCCATGSASDLLSDLRNTPKPTHHQNPVSQVTENGAKVEGEQALSSQDHQIQQGSPVHVRGQLGCHHPVPVKVAERAKSKIRLEDPGQLSK